MDQPSAPSPFRQSSTDAIRNEFDTGAVLGETLSIYLSGFIPFTVLVALVHAPILALELATRADNPLEPNIGAQFASLGLTLVLNNLAMAALVYGVFQRLRGRTVGFGECLTRGVQRMMPALFGGILTGLITFVGTLLLCVPGAIAMTVLYVTVPAIVVEGVGAIEGMKRSAMLTDGSRWRVFFIALGLAIVGMIAGGIIGVATVAALDPATAIVLQWLIGIIATAVGSVASSVIYFRLRQIKESITDIDAIAAVFD